VSITSNFEGCFLKQCDVLKVKSALLTSVCCLTEGSICNLVTIGLLCPWFWKELESCLKSRTGTHCRRDAIHLSLEFSGVVKIVRAKTRLHPPS